MVRSNRRRNKCVLCRDWIANKRKDCKYCHECAEKSFMIRRKILNIKQALQTAHGVKIAMTIKLKRK